ncbi:MAG: hypothetical protein U0L79_07910 [Lachnospiraceae bacterium]|nr:hypothetical protein [Lachnospiraceae bacterium]
MPIVKLTLNEESYQELKKLAEGENQSIQDYIRSKIFGSSIFTVDEAIERIQSGNFHNQELYPNGFELPDVYGDDWTIPRGPAGVFGKNFYNYIEANPDFGIKFKDMGKYGRRAVYTYKKED